MELGPKALASGMGKIQNPDAGASVSLALKGPLFNASVNRVLPEALMIRPFLIRKSLVLFH